MKIDASKILFTLFGVFILVFIGVTVFNYFYSPFETEMARQITYEQTIEVDALAVRDEKVITSDKSGIAVYSAENGSKVAKGADIISYYSDSDSAVKKKQIDELSRKIEKLSDINVQNSNYAADLELVTANINSHLLSALNSVDSGDLSRANEYSNELFYAMCQSGVTTGQISNLSDKISELKKQLDTLSKSYKQSSSTVTSDYSGYFVNSADGYENAVDFEKVSELTVGDFDKIKPIDVDKNAVGRVVCDTSWYLVAKIDADIARELSEGSRVKVALPISGDNNITAEITAINRDSAAGSAVIVLNCTNMNSDILQLRTQPIRIITKTYTGLRVNKKAVRVKDGDRGVYVSIGGVRYFRKIDIIYSGEEFVIVDSDNGSGQLKIYDDVIIKGRGLD